MTLPSVPWAQRPIEVANLLNPAFTSLLLSEGVLRYVKTAGQSMPFPLAFLLLPIALHPPTRGRLPGSTAALLHNWLEKNASVQEEASRIVERMVPYSREALMWGAQHDLLSFDNQAGIFARSKTLRDVFPKGSEAAECRDAARFLGTWFAKTSDVSLLFSLWGIRP